MRFVASKGEGFVKTTLIAPPWSRDPADGYNPGIPEWSAACSPDRGRTSEIIRETNSGSRLVKGPASHVAKALPFGEIEFVAPPRMFRLGCVPRCPCSIRTT